MIVYPSMPVPEKNAVEHTLQMIGFVLSFLKALAINDAIWILSSTS